MRAVGVCMCMSVCLCACLCACVCLSAYVCVFAFPSDNIYTYACGIYIYVCVCMYVCVLNVLVLCYHNYYNSYDNIFILLIIVSLLI